MKKVKKLLLLILISILFITTKSIYGAEVFENRIFYGNVSLIYQGENDKDRNVFLLSFNLPRESSTVFYANGIISNYNEFVTAGDDYQLLYVVDAVYNNAFISNVNGKLNSDNYLYLGNYDIIVLAYERIFTIRNGEIVFDMTLTAINDYYNNTSWSMYVEGLTGSQDAYDNGYADGKYDYGYYDNGEYYGGDYAYNKGYDSAQNYYGINHDGDLLTAEQWGDIRYGDGYSKGVDTTEIDWWSWSMTFFLMPFRILNIEILPGVKIGYFALFSLLIGVVGWFFFIVGKGGGRRK